MDHECTDNKTKRHESEHRDAFFDHAERAFPHHEPDDDRNWDGPPHKFDSGGEFDCDANTANLRCQNQQANEREDDVEKCEIVEAKTLANRVWYRASADCGEASGLFDEKDDAETTEHDGPDQLKREIRARLRRGGYRSDFKEPADACHDTEGDLHDLFHGASSSRSRFVVRRSASRNQPAKSARPAIT